MTWKKLVPIAAILVVLLCLVVIKQAYERPVPIEEAVDLPRLVPEGLEKADVAKLELRVGPKPNEKVILERVPDSPEEWQVSSHYNAPVDKKKIGDFLSLLTQLRGEIRERDAADEGLNSYELSDNRALHILGYKKGEPNPAFQILVGKQAGSGQVFARKMDSKDVLVLASNPRREAGLWSDDMEKAPEASPWLDKVIANLDPDKVNKLTIQAPHKRLVFEKREKPAPPSETEDQAEPAESAQETEEKPKEPEFEWVLVEGGGGRTFKQPGLDSLVRTFDNLNALDVVDPARKAEWGLEPAQFVCTIATTEAESPLIFEGGRPNPAEDGYMRVASRQRDVVYKVSKYTFDKAYGINKDLSLFDLEGLSLNAEDMAHVEVRQPEGDFVLAREEGKWKVVKPTAPLDPQLSTLNTVGSTLARWRAADYADSAKGTGLETPTRTVTFTTAAKDSHTLELGNDASFLDGAYARLDGGQSALFMSRMDINRIFVPPKDLYARQLLDVFEDDVQRIEVERATDAFTLARAPDNQDAWSLTSGGQTFEADSEAVEDLVTALDELEASDIVFGQRTLGEVPEATVRCVMEDGVEHLLHIGPASEGAHRAFLKARNLVCTLDPADVKEILPALDTLKAKPKEQPPPPQTPEEPEEAEQPQQTSESAQSVEQEGTAETLKPNQGREQAQAPDAPAS